MFDEKKKDKVEIVAQKQIEKQEKLTHQIKPHRGHSIFKIDKKTLDISLAQIEDIASVSKDRQGIMNVIHKKVIIEEGFFYMSALNIKNVEKKLIKAGIAVRKVS